MQIRFTEQNIKKLKLPSGSKDHQWFDQSVTGFGYRLFASGKANYFVKYRCGARQRRVTLGPYIPGILDEMRRSAAQIVIQAKQGTDFQEENKPGKSNDITLGEIIPLYLRARSQELSTEWHRELQKYLNNAWAQFHKHTLKSLDRGILVRNLDKIAEERGRVTADHCKKSLSSLYSWAIDRGYVETNPLMRLKRYQTGNGRKRALDLKELVAVWNARSEDDFGRIIGLLILTLQRKEEISELIWNELKFGIDPYIHLPSPRTKNRNEHIIPISKPALTIFNDIKRYPDRDYLFGEGSKGFQGWSKSKARLEVGACRLLQPDIMQELEDRTGDLTQVRHRREADSHCQALGYESFQEFKNSILPHWTLHDLRRTGVSLIEDYSLIERSVVEAILNHVSGESKGGVAGIYNRAKYTEQKRWALEHWGAFVMGAVHAYEADGFKAVKAYENAEKEKVKRSILKKSAESAESAGGRF